jgi:hypothetical protein
MNELEVAMTRARKVNPDGYVHARDAKEYQRLRDQARMWQEATAQVLATVGLGPGMNCLDVGCGLGAAMQLMAERVGPEGRVTGIESDAALAAQSLDELRREGGEFRVDRGRSRQVLRSTSPSAGSCSCICPHHHPRKDVGLDQARVPRGGAGVRLGAIAVEPTCPAMGEFNRVFEGVFRGHGRNMRAGRQLPAQFEAAGLGTPDETDAAVHFLPLSEMANMLIGVYDGLCAAGAELGLADLLWASEFRTEMAEAAAHVAIID